MTVFRYQLDGGARIRAEDYADGVGSAKQIVLSTLVNNDRMEFSFEPDKARQVAKQMTRYAKFLKPTAQERAAKRRRS